MAIMNINAKGKPLTAAQIEQARQNNAGAGADQQALTAQLAQLPGYQEHMTTLMQGSSLPERLRSYNALMDQAEAAGIVVPADFKMDMYGAVRDKTWAEKHPKLYVTLMVAGSVGGLAGGAALAGGLGGSAAAGLGPTTAGSMAATEAAAAGAGVPASLAGPAFGSGITSGLAGATAGGVGAGETGAVTGVAGSGFGGGAAAAPAAALPSTGAGVPLATGGYVSGSAPGNAALLAGAAKGGSSMGLSPEMWQLIASSGAGYLNNVGQGKNQAAADAAALERQRLATASAENNLDPFRQQMAQVQNLGRLDAMEQMKPIQRAAPVGKYAGVVAPGAIDSYAPSADMLTWLASMKRDVSSGRNTAPTMTNPSNYGKTSVLNLPPPGAQPGAQPASPYVAPMTLEEMLKQMRESRGTM